MRLEKKIATSTLWTCYSMLNSVKRKYDSKIQDFPRVTRLIKGFPEDLKQKAFILDEEDLKKIWLLKMDTAYWEVRKVIAITAVLGGLQMIECMNLELEKINRGPEGYTIMHSRAKQRSDKFLVPQEGGFTDILAIFLEKVKTKLEKYTGKVWYTGRKSATLMCQEYISSSKLAILVMANRLAGSGKKTLGQQEDKNYLAQQVDDYDYANMEED